MLNDQLEAYIRTKEIVPVRNDECVFGHGCDGGVIASESIAVTTYYYMNLVPQLSMLLPANSQEVGLEGHVNLDKVAINLQGLVVEHPRAMFFVATVLHQRREGTELSPANEQLFRATEDTRTGAIPTDVRAEVDVTIPRTVEIVL